MFLAFAVFYVICGVMHFVEIGTEWHPAGWSGAIIKAVAAVMAVAAAAVLWPLIPVMLQLPSRKSMHEVIAQLEGEIVERRSAEEALRQSQAILRELAAYQEKIREDERKRIAREIHDDLGQNLLALRLDVSILHARTSERHPNLNEKIGAALGHIDTTMKSVRAIINNLRPAVLDLGLHAAIEWQVNEFRRLSSIECELTMDHHGATLDDMQATAIFRVLQESLTNIRRHACATSVSIDMRTDGRQLWMVITDNGVGMYPNDRRKAHRFGLVGMAERIGMLGGELRIDSAPGEGTVLHLSIPMRAHGVPDVATGMGGDAVIAPLPARQT
ncbi:sensor histidine kinase [Noviherbaspirillum cavernae]|uniref:Sensor histidine kinase n=2 Tax=Noviherbaspirillum cavernae TaxID=2320862 RepID=A0A418X6N1_9BURK|nr:sensor histidine kinase [Noviherbaspirillum cavernae]